MVSFLVRVVKVCKLLKTLLLAVKIFPPPFLGGEVEVFDFFSRPGGFAQKCQTGFYRWVGGKAADGNMLAERLPAIVLKETADDLFQGDAVKRDFVVMLSHM